MTRLTPCIAALALLGGCSGPVDPRSLAPGRAGLQLELVDAPTHQVKEINVTIQRVTAHSNVDGWVEIFNQGPVTVDLLTLKTRVMDLGFRNLPAGRISQIRLYLTEGGTQNVVLPNGDVAPLKVPSGVQSGIKIKGPFELGSCNVTTVQLDFDGHRSIWYHPTGNGGDWILRPVIRTRHVKTQPGTCGPSGTGGGSAGPGGGVATGGGDGNTGGGSGAGGGSTGSGDAGVLIETPGGSCRVGSDCLSGVCLSNVCQPGAQGTPCQVGSNCASGVCSAEGSCEAPTAPPPAGAGSPCTAGSQCISGVCAGGVCSPGLQEQPCNVSADCDEGFSCIANVCTADLN